MKFRLKISTFFSISLCSIIFFSLYNTASIAQGRKKGKQQLITERFDYPLYRCNFDSVTAEWPVTSNSENLLLVQSGEYILLRKSKSSPFAAMGDFEKAFGSFHLRTSIKVTSNSIDAGSAGILFMTQTSGQGGFVIELNTQQQYRLRQITPGGYRYLTGLQKDGGWVKTHQLLANQFNQIDIFSHEQQYDILINDIPVHSFVDPTYTEGGIGYFIGPGATCKADFIDIFGNGKQTEKRSVENAVTENDSTVDVIALTESIVMLKSEINILKADKAELQQQLQTLKGIELESKNNSNQYEKRISLLEKQLNAEKKTIDSLLNVEKELLKYKQMVNDNGNGDLVISLSKNLKSEKLKNDELTRENEQLRKNLLLLQQEMNIQDTWSQPADTVKKGRGTFQLPNEN